MAEPTTPAFINVLNGQRITVADAISNGAITTDMLADGAVTTNKIALNAVFFSRMQDINTDRLLGRDTASSGDIEEISLSTGLQFSGSQSIRLADTAVTPGSYTNSNITVDQQGRLTAASSGSASSTISLIASGSISSAATLDIAIDGSSWDEVEINLINLVPQTDIVSLFARFSQSGSFLSGASDYQWAYIRGATASTDVADSEITLTDAVGNASNERFTAKVIIFRPTAASFTKTMIWSGGLRNNGAGTNQVNGWGELILNSDAIEDVQFLFSSGNITSGFYHAIGKIYS